MLVIIVKHLLFGAGLAQAGSVKRGLALKTLMKIALKVQSQSLAKPRQGQQNLHWLGSVEFGPSTAVAPLAQLFILCSMQFTRRNTYCTLKEYHHLNHRVL